MRQLKKLRWVMVAAIGVGTLPHLSFAADKSLEDRVSVLAKKVEQSDKAQSMQQQSVSDRVGAIEKEVKDSEKTIPTSASAASRLNLPALVAPVLIVSDLTSDCDDVWVAAQYCYL